MKSYEGISDRSPNSEHDKGQDADWSSNYDALNYRHVPNATQHSDSRKRHSGNNGSKNGSSDASIEEKQFNVALMQSSDDSDEEDFD